MTVSSLYWESLYTGKTVLILISGPGDLKLQLLWAYINCRTNNLIAGELRHRDAHVKSLRYIIKPAQITYSPNTGLSVGHATCGPTAAQIYHNILVLVSHLKTGCLEYHACWCPGSLSRRDINRRSIGCVGQTTLDCFSWVIFIFFGQADSKTRFKM